MKLILKYKTSNHISKKSTKKGPVSSTSSSLRENIIADRLDCMYGFELMPAEMKNWVRNRILNETTKSRYKANIKQSLLELRINELLYPYQQLSDYLGVIKHSQLAEMILKHLWSEPIRAKDIFDFFDVRVVDNFPSRRSWIYGFLSILVKYELVSVRLVGDREEDNIPPTTIRMPKLYYLKGIHTNQDIEEWVIRFVRRDAKQYPRKLSKNELLRLSEEREQEQEERTKRDLTNICDICGLNLIGIKFFYYEKIKVCIKCYKQKKHLEFKR